MALFTLKHTCFLGIGCLALASALGACSSGSNAEDTGPVTGTGGTGTGGGGPTAGNGGGAVSEPTVLYAFTNADDCIAWTPGNPSPAPAYDITPGSTIECDETTGQPSSPSLKIVAPFTEYTYKTLGNDQRVDIQFPAGATPPLDLTGKVLSVYIKLDSGFVGPDSGSPGGVVLYAKSGSAYDWGQAPWHNLINPDNAGKWIKYSFDMNKPDPGSKPEFDPSQIVSIGIMIDTGNPNAPAVPPSTGTFHLDTIQYQ